MATQALATREQSGAIAQRPVTEYDRLRGQLTNRIDDFKMALPAHITPEKFQRTVMTAAQSNPDLLKAERGSFITACMKAAQDGLLPDGREAAIVTFNNREKDAQGQWHTVTAAQYMPMVFGLRKKILQSGEISAIETNVVYRREVDEGYFVFEAGTEAMLRHKPMLDLADEDLTDDNIVAAYSVATMKDGTKSFEVMRRAEINKVRQTSKTGALGKTDRQGKPIPPKGPWVDWFGEMARKTVMRRHSKTLPMSGDLIDVEAADEALAARSASALLGSTEPDAQRALPPTREDIAIAEGADPVTGEIACDEEDEEVARQLDAETEARNNGTLSDDNPTAAEGPSDEQRGESNTGSPADDIIARVETAAIIGDVLGIEQSYQSGGREMFEVADQDRIEQAFADAKARLTGGK